MISKNKFEYALNALHFNFIKGRTFAYNNEYDKVIDQMNLSLNMISLFLERDDKTKEFEKLCFNFSNPNFRNDNKNISHFKNYKKATNNALINLRVLSLKTKNMVKNNINNIKIAKFLDDIEYLVSLMLYENINFFNKYLDAILNPPEKTKEMIEKNKKKIIKMFLDINFSPKKISKTTNFSISEIERIIKENNL